MPANIVDAESSGFEGGTTGTWTNNFFGGTACTIGNSSVRAKVGTKSMLATWPTATARGTAAVWATTLVIDQRYTFSVWVYVPTGSPSVSLGDIFGATPLSADSTVYDAWQQMTITFTATRVNHYFAVFNAAASTAGQQVWVDEFYGSLSSFAAFGIRL